MANHSPTLSKLIEQALAGDPAATRDFLGYLNSTNPDLRRMMQSALHSAYSEGVWQHILYCIGHSCWPELEPTGDQHEPGASKSTPARPGEIAGQSQQRFMESRAMQSLIEVYIIDSGPDPECELEVKQSVLLPALENPDRLTHWAAGYLLGLRGNLRAIPALDEIVSRECLPELNLSRDQCIHWQARAIQALAALNDVTCGPLLIKALANPERTMHHAAGQALAELGVLAEPALLAALHHPEAHIRWHAARALGQIGDLRAVDTLAEGLYDENSEVRWATARVLANLDCPAIPSILKALTTQPVNEPLRQSTYHALNSMACQYQHAIHTYLKPLLDVLRETSAASMSAVQAPAIAQRLLADWKNVSGEYAPKTAHREERGGFD